MRNRPGYSFPSMGRILLDPTAETAGVALDADDDFNDFAAGADDTSGVTSVSTADAETDETPALTPTPTTPADPNLAAGARQRVTPETPAAPSWASVREEASRVGYEFPEGVTDDLSALLHLVQRANTARQADYYSQVGRQVARDPRLQEYLSKPAAPAQPERHEWDRPDFRDEWGQLVDLDEKSGLYLAKQGAPPEIADKVNAYVAWQRKYQANPEGYIEHVAAQKFERLFQERFGEVQHRQEQTRAVNEIQQANAGWLYAKTSDGQYAYGRDGRLLPSPAGARYLQHIDSVAKMGVSDIRHQDYLARQMLSAEVSQAQQQQTQAVASQAASPQTQAARTRPNTNPAQTLAPSQRRAAGTPEPTTIGRSLMDSLRSGFDAEGLTDADFAYDDR